MMYNPTGVASNRKSIDRRKKVEQNNCDRSVKSIEQIIKLLYMTKQLNTIIACSGGNPPTKYG